MSEEAVMVRVSESGRISIPARQRKAVGLEDGGVAVARVDHGEIRIRPVRTVLAELQAKVRKHHLAKSGETVDRFLADRREEASREEH
jgi:AbrB family looped-hinge helix DNA binding protein